MSKGNEFLEQKENTKKKVFIFTDILTHRRIYPSTYIVRMLYL